MPRRLLLDNGPANLLCIARKCESQHRVRQRLQLSQYIASKFAKHQIYLPMSGAIELVDFAPTQRPFQEKWFHQARDPFLDPKSSPLERSQAIVDLWQSLETFYEVQNLEQAFRDKVKNTSFIFAPLATAIVGRLHELLNSDLQRRITILFILDDLQIACARKNVDSDLLASFQLLDGLHKSDVLNNYPAVLRLFANTYEIGQEKFFSIRRINEFSLKQNGDLLDCDLASTAVLGVHSSDGKHPADIVTLEASSELILRTLAVKIGINAWKKFMVDAFGANSPHFKPITSRSGTITFARLSGQEGDMKLLTIRRIFHVKDLRGGVLPKFDGDPHN